MSQINLIEAIRKLGFQGSDEEALASLHYIGLLPPRGLSPKMSSDGLKNFTVRNLNSAASELDGQLGGGAVDWSPEMTASLVGLALLNDGETLAEVLANLKTAALQSLAEETEFFDS